MKIKVGIIGCGSISEFRHAPEYWANQNAEIVSFYDPQRERADKLVKKFWGTVARDLFTGTLDKKLENGEPIAVNDNMMCLLKTKKSMMGTLAISWTHYLRGLRLSGGGLEDERGGGLLQGGTDPDERESVEQRRHRCLCQVHPRQDASADQR